MIQGTSKILNSSSELRKKFDTKAKQMNLLEGVKFYRLFWIFILCSILGYILEVAWCIMYHGRYISRNSLVFGPFSIVYGFGGVIITLIIHLLKNQKPVTIFVVTTISGAVFEFCCSLLQELIFGTVSWNYGNKPFTIGGRANLLFACGWGLLAILFFQNVLPFFNRLFSRIQNHKGLILTWMLILFMAGNMFLSATAVLRQSDRRNGIEASNAYERFLDRKYPDAVLKRIYANMRVVK